MSFRTLSLLSLVMYSSLAFSKTTFHSFESKNGNIYSLAISDEWPSLNQEKIRFDEIDFHIVKGLKLGGADSSNELLPIYIDRQKFEIQAANICKMLNLRPYSHGTTYSKGNEIGYEWKSDDNEMPSISDPIRPTELPYYTGPTTFIKLHSVICE